MHWKNLKNWKLVTKLGSGFGIVLILLVIVSGWSVYGISDIVENAEVVIDGNKLRGELVQRELDHLDWANQVSSLLTDDQNSNLDVQTDPHKCALGKWLNSAEAKQAYDNGDEDFKKNWDQMLKEHATLHESAIEIRKPCRSH